MGSLLDKSTRKATMKLSVFIFLFSLGHSLQENGDWVLVYSQRDVFSPRFRSECTLSSCNVQIDDETFINFDQVRDLAEYQMKFEWENHLTPHTLEWTQQPNPLSVTDQNLNVCANNGCTTTGNARTTDFHGLSISSNPNALLDGMEGGSWFYAVG